MVNVYIDKRKVEEAVRTALSEDVGAKDVTTGAVIRKDFKMKAHIISKAEGIVCGLPLCEKVFNILDEDIAFKPQLKEGDKLHDGGVIAYLEGEAARILTGERVALNFLSRLSGIATKTHAFVEKIGDSPVKIMDTRKTTPGLRYLEKYAVKVGGGHNHRSGLWDQVLIKDNHLKIRKLLTPKATLKELIVNTRNKIQRNIKIEIEVTTLKEFEDALAGKPDIIMLDNMPPDMIKEAVKLRNKVGKYPALEASGNISLGNIADYAKSGADRISIGSLTHSVNSIDFSMEVDAKV